MATRAKPGKAGAKADQRAIIAEALLEGAGDAAIHARLIAAGTSQGKADYELKRLATDPLFVAARRLANRLAKRDWTLGIYARLDAMADPGGAVADAAIPTIHAIDPEAFFRDYYRANRPVKLTGLVDHWPALARWDYDYLEAKVGDAVVELQGQRESGADYELAKDRHKRHARMADVLAALRTDQASNDYYVTAYNDTTNKQTLAPLWDDLGPVSLLRPSGGRDGFFWMGPKGTLTPFHHDLTNNLLVQVAGRKRVRLVPSWDVARMDNHRHCFSERQPADWDVPGRNLPRLIECIIDKGEAIFLPIGWWHHVEALDATISMSFTNFAADNNFTGDYPVDSTF